VSFLTRIVDERFLMHRLKSTSYAGMGVAAGSLLLFLYRLYVQQRWDLELLAVGAAFVAIKMSFMAWYVLTD
jgi:hypothetical protein